MLNTLVSEANPYIYSYYHCNDSRLSPQNLSIQAASGKYRCDIENSDVFVFSCRAGFLLALFVAENKPQELRKIADTFRQIEPNRVKTIVRHYLIIENKPKAQKDKQVYINNNFRNNYKYMNINKIDDIVYILWSILSVVVFIGFFCGWGGLFFSFLFGVYMVVNLLTAGVVMLPNALKDLLKKEKADKE